MALSCGTHRPGAVGGSGGGIFPVALDPRPPPRAHEGLAADIRAMVEAGDSASLIRALDFIQAQNLGETEFGRAMNAVAAALLQQLYPGLKSQMPPVDPPITHTYTKILRAVERGDYLAPPVNSQDYLEYTLPFLAVLRETQGDWFLRFLPSLEQARTLNPNSVLAPYFMGIVYERSGRAAEAEAAYRQTSALSPDCYPAGMGLARVMALQGRRQESVKLLANLVIQYPDNLMIKRQLALEYYHAQDWSRAEPAIAEILQQDPRDRQFILMRAQALVEQGRFLQAQTPLDRYGTMDPNNRLYLFLRARIQAEGYRNRDAALNYLRSILNAFPEDDEVSVYAARLLLASPRAGDQEEGQALLRRLIDAGNSSPLVTNLALQDAIHRGDWREARSYARKLLEERRDPEALLQAFRVEQGLGNNAAALALAQELYERDPANEEGVLAYISALINTGRQGEAGSLLDSRIAGLPGGSLKSRYYYLRSQMRSQEDEVMRELRSSLFEDPRNLEALIAMFELYQRHRDDRRAVYYLKQALALAPDNPQLKRWEAEYSALLGGGAF